MHIIKHFITITRHRRLVRQGCFRVGLYWRGLTHDLSKYSPTEFWTGAKYYQGYRSPNNAERETKGFSEAWLHHKGRNKHHYEYWMDYSATGTKGFVPAKMPKRYIIEMFMDNINVLQADFAPELYSIRSVSVLPKGQGAHHYGEAIQGFVRKAVDDVKGSGRGCYLCVYQNSDFE